MVGPSEISAFAEMLRMEDRRDYDEGRLSAFLGNPHVEVRRRAVQAAGRIRDPRAVDLLLTALADSAPGVRADAAFALGQLGDTTAPVLDALSSLALDPREDSGARAEAVAAIGKLGAPAGSATIEALLSGIEQETPETVVQEALLAVWRLPRDDRSAALVAVHASSENTERRWRAVYALMRLGDPGTIPVLLERTRDQDALVRALAARGLRKATADSAGLEAAAMTTFTGLANDPHPHVRINAVRALASYGLPELAPVIRDRLADRDGNVAIAAAEALAELGTTEAVPALEAVVRDTTVRLALRGAALTSLIRLDPEKGVAHAADLARSGEWLDRFYAARALQAAPWNLAAGELTTLSSDEDARVAAAALGSMGTHAADSLPAIYTIFVERLGSADSRIRTAAVRGLATRASPVDLPALLDAYDRAQNDTDDNDAALAAIAALGELARRGTPVARGFFLRFQRSADPLVRVEVERNLGRGTWGPPLPIETGKEIEFYEDVVRRIVIPDLVEGIRPRVAIRTAGGEITIELAAADAPLTVDNFLSLARRGYFNGSRWHRVVPNFVLQDGDPRGDGAGGPGYAIRDELNRVRYGRGTVGMALSGPDTGGSQFFITHSPQPHLDGGYTVFGRVVDGMDVADRVIQDDPIEAIDILQ